MSRKLYLTVLLSAALLVLGAGCRVTSGTSIIPATSVRQNIDLSGRYATRKDGKIVERFDVVSQGGNSYSVTAYKADQPGKKEKSTFRVLPMNGGRLLIEYYVDLASAYAYFIAVPVDGGKKVVLYELAESQEVLDLARSMGIQAQLCDDDEGEEVQEICDVRLEGQISPNQLVQFMNRGLGELTLEESGTYYRL